MEFKYDNNDLPILFEDGDIQVYKNPSGEIFIENKNGHVGLRIFHTVNTLQATAFGPHANHVRLAPTSVNGLDAFYVTSLNLILFKE